MPKLTDSSPMPFGKYKGEPMISVPASYLLWLYNDGLKLGSVRDYIVENMDMLKLESKEKFTPEDDQNTFEEGD